ncbi:hypothetical protein TIFTF001_055060 [Ficus carica]|uniref:Uncharacterized protein n=1 Tax=Ficus carica TaxID=3494 RepID=A0AA88JFM2_FICCA|nr:hypothetical protein TIFTF001_055060 [Ficus carica]
MGDHRRPADRGWGQWWGAGGGLSASVTGGRKVAGDGEDFGWKGYVPAETIDSSFKKLYQHSLTFNCSLGARAVTTLCMAPCPGREERERREEKREKGEEKEGARGVVGGAGGGRGASSGGRTVQAGGSGGGLGAGGGGPRERGEERDKRRERKGKREGGCRQPAGRGWGRWWGGRGGSPRERGEERERGREEKREKWGIIGGRPTGAGASGGGPEVACRRPSPVAERSPATEKTLGGKGNVR